MERWNRVQQQFECTICMMRSYHDNERVLFKGHCPSEFWNFALACSMILSFFPSEFCFEVQHDEVFSPIHSTLAKS